MLYSITLLLLASFAAYFAISATNLAIVNNSWTNNLETDISEMSNLEIHFHGKHLKNSGQLNSRT